MKDFQRRLHAILASPVVLAKRPSSAASWPLQLPAPPDVAEFHTLCDGVEIDQGVRILGREEVGISTKWLRDEKSLLWEDDIFIIGERDDLVVVRDMDIEGLRSGGGILEAPTDGLESLKRVAMDLVGYLEIRVGLGAQGAVGDPKPQMFNQSLDDAFPAPERLVQIGVRHRNAEMLEQALTQPFYPGNEADAALAALTLGELRAQAREMDAALQAFEQYAALRMRAARRGAESLERAAAFRAAARTAESAGAKDLAELCRQKAKN